MDPSAAIEFWKQVVVSPKNNKDKKELSVLWGELASCVHENQHSASGNATLMIRWRYYHSLGHVGATYKNSTRHLTA